MPNQILCIGEILWDALPTGLFIGGAPFNVACHLHMLGEDVIIASRIGRDVLGDQVIRRMTERNMSTALVQQDETYPTGIVNVTLKQADAPVYEIVEPVSWDFIEYNDSLQKAAERSSAIVFGSLAQRNTKSRETIECLIKNNPYTVFDVNLRPPFDDKEIVRCSLENSKIIKLNKDELKQLSKWFGMPDDMKSAARSLAERFKCNTVCVTRGGGGSALLHNDRWTEHPGYKVTLRDTVGSGDAFLAAFLSKLLKDEPADNILQFANAVGAYVAGFDGATPSMNINQVHSMISMGN